MQLSKPAALLDPDNHLFNLARRGELRLPAGLPAEARELIDRWLYPAAVLLFALMVPILSGLLGMPFVALLQAVAAPSTEAAAALVGLFGALVFGFLPVFVLVGIWLRLAEKRGLATTGMARQGATRNYLRGLLVGLVLFGTAVAVLALLGFVTLEDTTGAAGGAGVAGALFLLLAWMVQGAAEELLARGFVLPIVGARWGTVAGIVISSSLFSLLHFFNPNVSLLAFVNLFLFGVFAALYALYEGSLWGIFAVHSVWNWAQGNLFGFEVSGINVQSAIIFDFAEAGPNWLTGGPFGPEGGAVVTAVLTIACILVFVAQRRHGAPQEKFDEV